MKTFTFYFFRRFLLHISVRTYSKQIFFFLFDRTLEAVITLRLLKVSIGGHCLQNPEKSLIPYLIIRS